jgi:hypothetical protein
VSISLATAGEGTRVVWTFDYDVGWHLQYRYVFLFMRGTMNDLYDRGLASLKKLVEGERGGAESGR